MPYEQWQAPCAESGRPTNPLALIERTALLLQGLLFVEDGCQHYTQEDNYS
jgi:hypothetical protein